MVKIDISLALFFYLFGTVIVTILLWMWLDRKVKFNAFKIGGEDVWQCSICGYVYIDRESENLSRCPRCKSINKRRETGKKKEEVYSA